MLKKFATATTLLLLITGCVSGLQKKDITQESVIYSAESNKNYQEIWGCFNEKINSGYLIDKSPYSELNYAESMLGTHQLGEIRYFYMLKFNKTAQGTLIELRKSPSNLPYLTLDEVTKAVDFCTQSQQSKTPEK